MYKLKTHIGETWQCRKLINERDEAGNEILPPRVAIEVSNGYASMVLPERIINLMVELLNKPYTQLPLSYKGGALIESNNWEYVVND